MNTPDPTNEFDLETVKKILEQATEHLSEEDQRTAKDFAFQVAIWGLNYGKGELARRMKKGMEDHNYSPTKVSALIRHYLTIMEMVVEEFGPNSDWPDEVDNEA